MDFEKDFREWYFKNHCKSNIKYEDLMPHHIEDIFGWFDNLPLSFRWGVMVDFFDEKGIVIEDGQWWNQDSNTTYWTATINDKEIVDYLDNRQEARKEALQKAIEIYNQNTKTK